MWNTDAFIFNWLLDSWPILGFRIQNTLICCEAIFSLDFCFQYLHLLGVGTRPVKDADTGISYLKHTDLPHIINPIEAYLGMASVQWVSFM